MESALQSSDSQRVKLLKKTSRSAVCLLIILQLLLPLQTIFAYRIIYREQLYELHHRQLYNYPLDIAENIYWLELALRADFANPLVCPGPH